MKELVLQPLFLFARFLTKKNAVTLKQLQLLEQTNTQTDIAATKLKWPRGKFIKNKPAAQAAGQTFPNATPPVDKIHPFSKIAVTIEPLRQFRCPSRLGIFEKC